MFNEYTVQALLTLGEIHSLSCFKDVAQYMKIFVTWWTVMNVKVPYLGCRHKNKYAAH